MSERNQNNLVITIVNEVKGIGCTALVQSGKVCCGINPQHCCTAWDGEPCPSCHNQAALQIYRRHIADIDKNRQAFYSEP